jgi:hypothetical protein
MPRTSFDPTKHGFRFKNGEVAWTRVPLPFGKVLCGGMAYAAMDYYLNHLPIPADPQPPAIDSLLNNYLYDRQLDAHKNTVGRFLGDWLTSDDGWDPLWQDSSSFRGAGGNYGKLMKALGALKPAVLCLIGQSAFRGHHVVAIGCDPPDPSSGALTVQLYDSNHPMKVVELASTTGIPGYRGPVGFKHSTTGEVWRGFFVDDGYRKQSPYTLMKDNWRFCTRCKGLFWGGPTPRPGDCPPGGLHAPAPAWNYALRFGPMTKCEEGWRRCLSCQQLYLGGDKGPTGHCRSGAGGRHSCSRSEEYSLRLGPLDTNLHRTNKLVEEADWRRCKKCEVLYYEGPGGLASSCAGGAGHVDAGTQYWLDKVSA